MTQVQRSAVLLFAWPAVVAFGVIAAVWLPTDHIWAQAFAAVLLSLPPWAALVWPLWMLAVRRWTGERSRWMGIAWLGLLGIGVPLRFAPGAGAIGKDDLSVAVLNVNSYSPQTDPTPLADQVQSLLADVVVILEKRPETFPGYHRVADDFAYPWSRPSHHTAVFVRDGLDIAAAVVGPYGSPSLSMPFAIVDGGSACVVGIHAPPQVPIDPTGMDPYLQFLESHIAAGRLTQDIPPCTSGQAVVVAGDLNHVPGSVPWRRLRSLGLEDQVGHAGLFGITWPSGGGWPNAPVFRLDHVLSGPVTIRALRKVDVPGSDHQGWYFSVGR